MKRNLSDLDRTLRVIVAAVLAYVYFAGFVTGAPGIFLLVLGAVFLLTSIFAFCPLYTLFRFTTYR